MNHKQMEEKMIKKMKKRTKFIKLLREKKLRLKEERMKREKDWLRQR